MFLLWIHRNSSKCYLAQVIPFGNLRVKACLPLPAGSKAYSKSASRQRILRDFCNFLPGHNSFRSSGLSIPLVTGGELLCAECKIGCESKENDQCETLRLFYRRSNADFVEQTS